MTQSQVGQVFDEIYGEHYSKSSISRMIERTGYSFSGEQTALLRTMQFTDNTGKTEEYAYSYDGWGRLTRTDHTFNGSTLMLSKNSYDAVGRLGATARGGTAPANSPSALASTYSYNVRYWLTGINGTLFSESLTYESPRLSTLPKQWSGNISGVQWGTGSTLNYKYDFKYDLLGRIAEADYSGGTGTFDHSRTYTYDLNGNLTKREASENANLFQGVWQEWTWNSGNGNRPGTWHQERNLTGQNNPQFPSGKAEEADEAYAYDAVGNRRAVLDGQGDTLSVLSYNLLNLPKEYRLADGSKERYVYSADGEKLYVQHVTSSNVTTGTEYAANYRFENGSIAMIHTDAGYYTPVPPPSGSGNPTYMHVWYLKDHLGNNRVLADGTGTALRNHHYDPFGEAITLTGSSSSPFPTGATESPYKYGGKEWSDATSTYDFEARQFSPNFHRFTTMDPLCEKYYGISPYVYCANNPVNYVDPKGDSLAVLAINRPHLAMLIQNENGEWQYYSINGNNQWYPIIGFWGGRYFDDLQVGNFSSVFEFLHSNYNTSGETQEEKLSDPSIAGYNYVEGYVIPTSPEQDKRASEEFIRISTNEEYHLILPSNHCSTTVERSLLAAGMDVRKTVYYQDGYGQEMIVKQPHILPANAYKAIKQKIPGEVVRR